MYEEEVSENEVVVEEEEEGEEDVFIEKVFFEVEECLVLKVDREINIDSVVLFFIVVCFKDWRVGVLLIGLFF